MTKLEMEITERFGAWIQYFCNVEEFEILGLSTEREYKKMSKAMSARE